MRLNKAFTLAEVLMTLAILGVVATMTVSNIHQNIQQREFITKYRKTFSAIDNAFQKYQLETGNWTINPQIADPNNPGKFLNWRGNGGAIPGVSNGGQTVALGNEFFVPYLNATIQPNENHNNLFSIYNNNKGIKVLNGSNAENPYMWRHGKYILPDGTEIIIYSCHLHWVKDQSNADAGVFNAVMLIDVNGEAKAPNTIGKDIQMVWLLTTGLYPNPLPERYDATTIQDIRYFSNKQHSTEHCAKNSSGATCARWFLNHEGFDH